MTNSKKLNDSDLQKPSEIFRHFRPLEVNQRGELVSKRNGGVSFLCRQNADSSIDFWIYICPLNAGFSARAAVTKLRKISTSADPWGRIETPTEDPLILQLVTIVARGSALPTGVTGLLREIAATNLDATDKHALLKEQHTINIYAND